MNITKIIINNFRNHDHSEIQLSDGINVFVGKNGSGKTSILEAITVLSLSKSFLPVSDSSLIQAQLNFYRIELNAKNSLDSDYKVKIVYERGGRKQISSTYGENLNPKDIIGEVPIVVLSPDYKAITFGSPEDRREFLDKILSQSSRLYIDHILNLKKSLKQRNNLLNQYKLHKTLDRNQFEIWTEFFINNAVEVYLRRNEFIKSFTPIFESYYKIIASDKETVSLEYQPNGISTENLCNQDKNMIKENLINYFHKISDDEMRRGTTLFGPQKDDIKILVNRRSAKDSASQGQHKSLLISLKFGEFEYLKEIKNETPVVLLDDIFAELDLERSAKVIDILRSSNTQTFITITDTNILKSIENNSELSYFWVEDGRVS
ncbi:MAG: DNA replication and repair protein RecF [Candidatus Kapabacteria bacterium]|nr:DNA replication and repair protein RecF [Candidatus Kapabacteria bacterium]